MIDKPAFLCYTIINNFYLRKERKSGGTPRGPCLSGSIMEKKKSIFFWVTLAVSIVIGLISLVANYYSLFAEGVSVISRFANCFTVISVLCGLMYFVYGAAKNAAAYYKIFVLSFAGVALFSVASVAYDAANSGKAGKAAVLALVYGLLFGMLVGLFSGKDLGKKKTWILAAASVVIVVGTFVYSLIENGGLSQMEAGRVFGHLDLALMLLFMVYAKYADKASRGSK